ncbi:Mitochondrial 37S ribosomal protein nam9 [Madurella fahalii]|uniref:Mitochondrial 37S ribosomal protein nam9 n=1 Tax=Madurella fahalii TaxID=1157608 RepID=A0ABQ0GMC2_9PEZI
MKQRRLLRFHGLRRPRIRQTWNKYNLFNLVKLRTPNFMPKTFFQQKWIAKSLTRGYHGEHIKEYQWERMFSRRPLSAVNMDPAYMARRDGSEQAAGRGSGRSGQDDNKNWMKNKGNLDQPTPYMQMTFAPLERRLDIAIFRALFASSARQARQFVLHGAVTVNGKKMLHPSYLLNPGDMFQVDIERVMTATGKPKRSAKEPRKVPKLRLYKADMNKAKAEGASAEVPEAAEAAEEELDDEAIRKQNLQFFAELRKVAYDVGQYKRGSRLRAKQKQYLRELVREMKSVLSQAIPPQGVKSQMQAMFRYLSLTPAERENKQIGDVQQAVFDQLSKQQQEAEAADSKAKRWLRLGRSQQNAIRKALRDEAENRGSAAAATDDNPYDLSKPYLTPWEPRDWMSPFAFIPRYLEVNQKICAAVYLRHPVARPGISEVPTPFSSKVSQLAFNWYLRRS